MFWFLILLCAFTTVQAQIVNNISTYAVGSDPGGIAIDSTGNVWVANYGSGTVTKLSNIGSILGTFTVGSSPSRIVIDGSGNVWVSNSEDGTVTKLTFLATGSPSVAVGECTTCVCV